MGVMGLEEINGVCTYGEKRSELGPHSIPKLGGHTEEHKGSSKGDGAGTSSDVGVRPGESGFRKLAMKVFQEGTMEGRKKQLFPNVADSLPLNLQSGDS